MRGTVVKFSEDVVPLGDMKVNPGKVVRRIDETGRPVLLTSHGRGVAVVQALGIKAIKIGPPIAPGVPVTQTLGDMPMLLALKSGNFGDREFFAKALAMMS
ncbi:MAG: type II toxin-antitoxin system prevent-host-death family antitoxin [candidate division NC10 bacterium]